MDRRAPLSTQTPSAMIAESKPAPSVLNFVETCSHVSSHWRQVALATPVLWREVMFSMKATKNRRERVWLERSKETPLTIHFPCMNKQLFTSLLEMLRPHLHRAESISNEGHQIGLLLNLLGTLPPRLDNLSALILRTYCVSSHPLADGTVQGLVVEGTTHLQYVLLQCVPLNLVMFPTNNITKLCLAHTEICITQLDNLLHSVISTLKWLSIELINDAPPRDAFTRSLKRSRSPTPFPNLNMLELAEDGVLISTHIVTNFW